MALRGRTKITLRQLEVFDAVANAGSLTAAAEKLNMSLSAASSALSDLETILRRPLFAHAKGRTMRITEEGERLRPLIRSQLNGIFEIENDEAAPLEGKLVIGATAMIAETILPRICVDFVRLHPGVRIFIDANSADNLFERLSRFELEAAVIEFSPEVAELELVRWRSDDLWLVVAPEHPLAGQRDLSVGDLAGFAWCLREPTSSTASRLRFVLHEKLGAVPIAIESTSNWAVRVAVLSGGGIGCLSQIIVRYDVEHHRLVRLIVRDFEISGALSFAKPKAVRHGRLVTAFEEFLLSQED